MEEIWKDVVGYEGLYKVSNIGRVCSLVKNTRIFDKDKKIMRQKLDNHGYFRVNLHLKGKCKAELVSRLVANAFIENPNGFPHVGHNDDIKTNNSVKNLYWTDAKENNNHNGKMDRFQQKHKEKIKLIAQKLSVAVKATSLDGTNNLYFNSMQEAQRNGFSCAKISMCVNGKAKTHKGYTWERI